MICEHAICSYDMLVHMMCSYDMLVHMTCSYDMLVHITCSYDICSYMSNGMSSPSSPIMPELRLKRIREKIWN